MRADTLPEDWQNLWANTTLDVCEMVWHEKAMRLYPRSPVLRDDLRDWLIVKAQEIATRYVPPVSNPADPERLWGSCLAASLRNASRWHWATTVGADNEDNRAAARQQNSLDALLDKMHEPELHGVAVTATYGWKPMNPEQAVIFLEDAHRYVSWANRHQHHVTETATSTCGHYGCDKPIRADNLCQGHYVRRAKLWGRTGKPCEIPGCVLPAYIRGFCDKHHNARTTGKLDPVLEKYLLPDARTISGGTAPRQCREDGCDRNVDALNLCSLHYQRLKRTGTTAAPVRRQTCERPGCDRPHLAKGLCSRHYAQQRKAAA